MKLFGGQPKKTGLRKGKRTRKTWLHMPRWLVAGLAVVLLLAGGVFVAQALLIHPPTLGPESNENLPSETAPPLAPPATSGITPEVVPTEEPDEWTRLGRREGVYTVLLVGTDQYGSNTDTLMVAALDVANGTLKIVSIPRDTQVNVTRRIKKINGAMSEGGIDELKRELATVIGFQPDNYAVVNLKGFVRLVDAVGGVDFDVPQNMNYDDPTQNLHIHLQKGFQHLDGAKAIQLMRYRSGYAMADITRMEVQQKFLKAVAKQTLQLGNLFKLGEFIDIANENLSSDLGTGEMIWFGQELMKLSADDISFYTLPVDAGYLYNSEDYALVREEEALALINETVNPYRTPRDADDLDLSRLWDTQRP
ncbi:MAG: LCP family protein [Oscillospiraceae bacterium]|jgi:LCP family protein required for cell wall assembly|nr:LCP family protein [Oscillospiraceae bacterium]